MDPSDATDTLSNYRSVLTALDATDGLAISLMRYINDGRADPLDPTTILFTDGLLGVQVPNL